MNNRLAEVLTRIAEDHKDQLRPGSRFYREISIGREAGRLGFDDLKQAYEGVFAIVPLERPAEGMTVRIDGRTFVDYAQLASGLVVPGYAARAAELPFTAYAPHDSMVLNFV
ncbi:MAG: hypothetical protein MUD16_06585 [Desulfobacterales bacterium]|jgi:hypothetical protein|nr:hypothetical protein [Desulfobacterales bacterium]